LAVLTRGYPDVPPRTWLHAATQGGAAALGLEHLGALAPGKRPGLLDVTPLDDTDAATDPERTLVTHGPATVKWAPSIRTIREVSS
ncbi:MAG: hypothetical protein ABIW57_14280, partial [Polyangia bacterium]